LSRCQSRASSPQVTTTIKVKTGFPKFEPICWNSLFLAWKVSTAEIPPTL
jgi:hypothetical protein